MTEFHDRFGKKVNGELFKVEDWNGLTQLLDNKFADLDAAMADVGQQVSDVTGDVAELREQLNRVERWLSAIEPRLMYMTLSTDKAHAPVGERATLTAQLSRFDGTPLKLGDPEQNPWVDFVTTWGTLSPAPGFITTVTASDQSLSVRVDNDGVAQVQVRAENADAFDDAEEVQIQTFLDNKLRLEDESQLKRIFMRSGSPLDDEVRDAFRKVSQVYEEPQNRTVRRFLDAHMKGNVLRNEANKTLFRGRWRDYRCTVMAFAKPDRNPATPDGAVAVASIQVAFRDWVSQWVSNDYLLIPDDLKERLKQLLGSRFSRDFNTSLESIMEAISDFVRDQGTLGKHRSLKAFIKALREVNPNIDVDFARELTDIVAQSLDLELDLLYGKTLVDLADDDRRDDIKSGRSLARTNSRSKADSEQVEAKLREEVLQTVNSVKEQVIAEARREQATFESRLLRPDGEITSARARLDDAESKVQELSEKLGRKADHDLVSRLVNFPGTNP